MTDAIVVRGIRADGRHGLAGERDVAQPFVVDVDIVGDLAHAAAADTIDATLDYGVIADEVRNVVSDESYELIEALAEAIAARVLSLGANSVRVRVSKPKAAETLAVDEVAVVVER